jgi:Kef-type K+ transport system membrane component KefB
MLLLTLSMLTLPFTNPVLKFLVILIIILLAPIIFNRIRMPHILGLIVAGIIIGPNGFNLILRDSSIILSGTAGLLYIMFLAGLEIDLVQFRKNSFRSIVFGLYTFIVPMGLGFVAGFYLLKFSIPTSILLASLFASHTLIAYPILSKLGITKTRVVNIAVGGTMITDTLALLVLAVIVGMTVSEVNGKFWIRLSLSIIASGSIIIFLFPLITRWFFKHVSDSVSQYIFVLVMVFLGAYLAELAGIEAIIGAFLAGLALNRLVPNTSSLMNRIEFVGNAVFIPFFLIGVGMLVDYRVFFADFETIKVAIVMTVVAATAKFIAAWLTQKTFRLSVDERRIIFGLSNAQAAATLAAVTVGYNVITGTMPDGSPIRLLDESVLNGAIVMILVTCTIATFITQKGGNNISIQESHSGHEDEADTGERVLIPVNNPETIDELISLSSIIRSSNNHSGFYVLNIIQNSRSDMDAVQTANRILDKAVYSGSSADLRLQRILRYDLKTVDGIASVIKEQSITDLIMGLHIKKEISESFLGKVTEGILTKCNITTFIYKPVQPVSTIKRHVIVIPEKAEVEMGFPLWVVKMWNIARNTGIKLLFYGSERTIRLLREVNVKHPVEAEFRRFSDWDDFLVLSRDIRDDDNLIIVLSRENKPSYHRGMAKVSHYLNHYFQNNSLILLYPMQSGVGEPEEIDLNNPSMLDSIEMLDEIRKNIAHLFMKK